MLQDTKGPSRLDRLAQMSTGEVRTRTVQALIRRADEWRSRLGFDPPGAHLDGIQPRAGRFFFTADELPSLAQLLRERMRDEARAIVEEAERICRHRFDLLGYRDLDYGPEIDWHLDAVHGKHTPLKMARKIHYLDFNEVGDHKVTWELNRHQHFVTLAKAYQLTQEDRFAAEIVRQWRGWNRQNPYPIGINWASSLEVAFRSLSWLWMHHLLAGCRFLTSEFQLELRRALALSGRHIAWNLSTYFSPNTHLLGEGVALFFIGTLDPSLPRADRWRRRGWEMVLEQAHRQVRPDGLHFEQSLYYHVYALDFFLHARVLAAANGVGIPDWFDGTVLKMLEVLQALGTNPPRFGDDDGGRLFNPRRNRGEHLLDPLATGAILFRRPDFKRAAPGLREETLWLLGVRGAEAYDALDAVEDSVTSKAFPSSGVYMVQDDTPARLTVLAGSSDSGTGGHAHADALSVYLVAHDREWLIDPGTFCYVSASGEEREAFRGTAAHNTLEVDGVSQAEPCGPFAWRGLVKPVVDTWTRGKTFELFVGAHTGYRRLPQPVEHRRWVVHLKSGLWMVRDVVDGGGKHRLALRWHFAPGIDIQRISDDTAITRPRITGEGKATNQALAFLAAGGHGWRSETKEGQFSPAYGAREPNAVLVFDTDSALPADFALLLRFGEFSSEDPGASPDGSEAQRVERQIGRLAKLQAPSVKSVAAAYSYSREQEKHLFCFGAGPQRWSFGAWTSDAAFLYFARSAGKEHLILCEGSYATIAGEKLVECARPVERIEWSLEEGEERFLRSDAEAVVKRNASALQKYADP